MLFFFRFFFLIFENVQTNANIEQMRADGAHLFRNLFLKKVHCEVHFDQNSGNEISIETSKMNIISYVLWYL